jgi:hypothetical protein
MKTRTFRHKNSKTRKSKKGGQSLAAVNFALRNPRTVAAMGSALNAAKGVGNKANKVGANLGKELNKVKNSDQAQKAIKGMTNIKNTGMNKFNQVKNSDQAQVAKEKFKKKGNEFGNMASNFMNSMRKGGRKWSLKYKRSINCKRPKGFSQKQHCKYGRRKSRRTRKSRK